MKTHYSRHHYGKQLKYKSVTSHNVLDLFKNQPKGAKIDDCNERGRPAHTDTVCEESLTSLADDQTASGGSIATEEVETRAEILTKEIDVTVVSPLCHAQWQNSD